MTKAGGVWAVGLALTLGCLALAARAWGQAGPLPSVLSSLHANCPPGVEACWYGLTLNDTRIRDLPGALDALNFSVETYYPADDPLALTARSPGGAPCMLYTLGKLDDPINTLTATYCDPLRLGELLLMLPRAQVMHVCAPGANTARLLLAGQAMLQVQAPVTPYSMVSQVVFRARHDWPAGDDRLFAPRWRSCEVQS